MPIVFVHGVANREDHPLWELSHSALELFLKEYVAPAISPDPNGVSVLFPYWGDLGATFAWGGISRPRSAFLGHGGKQVTAAEQAQRVAEFQSSLSATPDVASTASSENWVAHGASNGAAVLDLSQLSPAELGDLVSALLHAIVADPDDYARAVLIADAVAHHPDTLVTLKQYPPGDAQVVHLTNLLKDALDPRPGLIGQGSNGRLSDLRARLGETVSRALGLPGWLAAQLMSEIRAPIHEGVSIFFGDVFRYLASRGTHDDPGPIPKRMIETLVRAQAIQQQRGNEPIVVLSHSMGGQIIYDLVTSFLPSVAPTLKIDFWGACGSQVGLMEELKLFIRSSDEYGAAQHNMVPNPAGPHLGHWWNVWDPNDFISFTGRNIFADLDDSSFDSGLSLVTAHGGYLIRPSFFREFAQRVARAVKDL